MTGKLWRAEEYVGREIEERDRKGVRGNGKSLDRRGEILN